MPCHMCGKRRYRPSQGNGMCCRCIAEQNRRQYVKHENGWWTRETCLQAGREWYQLTGYAPRSEQWGAARGSFRRFPPKGTIRKLFGGWRAFINELDLPRPPRRGANTIETCIAAGLVFVATYSHIPTVSQWNEARMYPCSHTVRKCFGSWLTFKAALTEAITVTQGQRSGVSARMTPSGHYVLPVPEQADRGRG
jgi:hypothetical protein